MASPILPLKVVFSTFLAQHQGLSGHTITTAEMDCILQTSVKPSVSGNCKCIPNHGSFGQNNFFSAYVRLEGNVQHAGIINITERCTLKHIMLKDWFNSTFRICWTDVMDEDFALSGGRNNR